MLSDEQYTSLQSFKTQILLANSSKWFQIFDLNCTHGFGWIVVHFKNRKLLIYNVLMQFDVKIVKF